MLDLGNYQRYVDDFDDYLEDGILYYQVGGVFGVDFVVVVNVRNCNSVLSLGGGLFGRVKNKFGMGQGYLEMDLLLMELWMGLRFEFGGVGGGVFLLKDKGNFKFGFGWLKFDLLIFGF